MVAPQVRLEVARLRIMAILLLPDLTLLITQLDLPELVLSRKMVLVL